MGVFFSPECMHLSTDQRRGGRKGAREGGKKGGRKDGREGGRQGGRQGEGKEGREGEGWRKAGTNTNKNLWILKNLWFVLFLKTSCTKKQHFRKMEDKSEI